MPAKVVVTGGPETAHAFDQLRGDIADLSGAHDKVARARLPGVARRTPVRTGELRGSWETSSAPDSGSILSPLPYAGPVEYGVPARGIVGAAMIARTLEEESAAIAAEYEAAIRDRAKARGFRVA